MKKKLLVLVCACVLALALPVIAFAAPSGSVSGETTTSTGTEGVSGSADSLTFTAEGADWLLIEQDNESFAANVPTDLIKSIADKDGSIVGYATYYLDAGDNVDKSKVKVTLVYMTDKDNAGLTCKVFVAHDDDTFEEFTLPVASDGSVTVDMNKLSMVTFFITNQKYESNTTPAAAAVTDTKATSPQTGVVA